MFIGIALGTTVVIANAIGSDDRESVQNAVHTSMVMAVVGGVIVAIIGELMAGGLLTLLKVPEDVYPLSLLYLRIYFLGMPAILLYNFEAAIFRSIGETKVPLIALASSGVLNVLLNLVFVLGFDMTVNGVAIATVLSNVVSSILLYRRLRKTDQYIHVDPAATRHPLGQLPANHAHRPARRHPERRLRRLQHRHPVRHQQPGHHRHGRLQRCAEHRDHRLLRHELLQPGLRHLCGPELRCRAGQALPENPRPVHFGGRHRHCVRHLSSSSSPEDSFWPCSTQTRRSSTSAISRLLIVFTAYAFSMLYEVMSGYLRGFGISLAPALLVIFGVCGIRILWISFVFPVKRTFSTILYVYPISLATTALLIGIALLVFRPSKRLAGQAQNADSASAT